METTLNHSNDINESERESWVDFVKVTAIFLVVLLHSAAPWVYRYGLIADFDWQVGNIIDSATRVSVPLFFMTTGYLLLSKPIYLKTYFNKRVKRIALPWLAWSIIYLIYKSSRSDSLITISEGLLAFINGDIYFHFWFLYTLIGLYLFIPVISWFLEAELQKRSLYFLTLWLISISIFPFLNAFSRNITNFEIKFAVDLSMFGGFTGYIIAGALISKCNPSKTQWLLIFAAYTIGVAITFTGTAAGTYKLGRLIEYFYDYAAPNVILTAFAAFLLLKKVGTMMGQNRKASLVFTRLGYASLGIFLIHPMFINALNDGMLGQNFTTVIQRSALTIPLVAIITFILSYIAVELILVFPVIRRIV